MVWGLCNAQRETLCTCLIQQVSECLKFHFLLPWFRAKHTETNNDQMLPEITHKRSVFVQLLPLQINLNHFVVTTWLYFLTVCLQDPAEHALAQASYILVVFRYGTSTVSNH